jgi:MYXO-CTERM domain-containing protein
MQSMSAFRRVLGWRAHSHIQVAVAFAMLAWQASTAHAFCRLTTKMPLPGDTCAEQGAPLAWKRQCISFSMTDRRRNDPPLEEIRNVADASFATWADVTCGGQPVALDIRETLALGECANPEYNRTAANANTVIFVSDWDARKLPRDAFGLTLVWHNPDSGEIYDADMQINETLGMLSVCNGVCPSGRVDLQNVITHEAGHFLGLGHSDDTRATMAARAPVGETKKRDLADDDRAGLCSIYPTPPAASCERSDFEPDRGFSPVCMPPSQKAVRQSSACTVSHAGVPGPRGAWSLAALGAAAILLRRRSRR